MEKLFRKSDWANLLRVDIGHEKYQQFNEQLMTARKLEMYKYTPSDLGVDLSDKMAVRWHSLGQNIRELYGRAIDNPVIPKAYPFEGKNVEQEFTKICDCIWKFEASSKRGFGNRQMMQEAYKVVMDSFWEGMSYMDVRIVGELADDIFYNGLTVYQRMFANHVILDHKAKDFNGITHLHIIHREPKDMVEATFNVDLKNNVGGSYIYHSDPTGTEYYDSEQVEVIETQYMKYHAEDLVTLHPEAQKELGISRKAIFMSDLKKLVNELKAQYPDQFGDFDLRAFVKYQQKQRRMRKSWHCVYHVGGNIIHDDEYYLGDEHTLVPLYYFPEPGSPYAYGIPYFNKDAVRMQMLARTQLVRLMGALLRRQGIYDGVADKNFKRAWEENTIGALLETGRIEGLDERPIKDRLLVKEYGPEMQNLIAYDRMLEFNINQTFANFGPGQGRAPYSQASGEAIDELKQGEGLMFTVFRVALDKFFSDLLRTSLICAATSIPKEVLLVIAAENDEARAKIIMSEDFYRRLSNINVEVKLDLTSARDKMLLKDMIMKLMLGDRFPEDPGYELLEVPEAKRVADAQSQYKMQMNEYLKVGKMILDNPIIAKTYLPKIANDLKMIEALNAKNNKA